MQSIGPIRHVGIYDYRLVNNPLEKVYSEHWEKLAEEYLKTLLYGPNKDSENERNLERDAVVAATIIQWLGSPVGQGFLEEVREKFAKKGKKQ